MSTAVTARQQGDDYQAYHFWMLAAEMLRPTAKIAEVGYEVGDYKSFDDVAVKYARPRIHAHGIKVDASYFQIKFSVNYGKAITAEALVDPSFVGAQSVSFLERLRDAVQNMPAGASHRFVLITSRLPDPNDPLSTLLNTSKGSINCDALFQGMTPKSRMGRVRELWASKLDLKDELELVPILQRLQIDVWPHNLQRIIAELNTRLELAGLQSWPDANRANPYPKLIQALCSEGKRWFTGNCIRKAAEHDGLAIAGSHWAASTSTRLGIRTFMRWAESMEDETDAMLCLCGHFVDRYIRSSELWDTEIIPSIINFLRSNVRPCGNYVIDLQVLTSVAFLTGYLLDPKLNVKLAIVQDRGSIPWEVDPNRISGVSDRWEKHITSVDNGSDLVAGISISRPVTDDVTAYISEASLRVKEVVSLEPQGGPGQKTIVDATDAYGLAQHIVNYLSKIRKEKGITGPTHLFLAAPNVFSFFLGQLARPLGEIKLYEYDFGSGETGAYTPSLNIKHELRL